MRVLNEEDLFYGGLIHVPSVHFDLVSLISGPAGKSLGGFDQVLQGEKVPFQDTPPSSLLGRFWGSCIRNSWHSITHDHGRRRSVN